MNNPLLIHLTLFLSYLSAFSLQLFFTSGLLSWFVKVKSFLTILRMSRSVVKVSSEFCGWWFLKVCFSSELPRHYIFSFALHNFFMCPILLFSFPRLKHLSPLKVCQQAVWYAKSARLISVLCAFLSIDLWFVAEVSTSYLFSLFLSYLNQWSTWKRGIPSMHCCKDFLSLLLN